MNIDDLKQQWNQDQPLSDLNLENTHQQAKHPIEKLKKTIKQEYIMQVLSIVFAAIIPLFANLNTFIFTAYYSFYAILVIITLYYFKGFYEFYNKIDHLNQSTRNSLWELYYDLKLQIERYKSFGFLLIPFIGMFILLLSLENGNLNLNQNKIYLLISIISFFTVIFITIIVFWAEMIYGKIAKKLFIILQEFEQ